MLLYPRRGALPVACGILYQNEHTMNALNADSLTARRLVTLQVKAGNLSIGSDFPIRLQTMTTTDTMDTAATVDQVIRCADAGADLVRITAPGLRDAENLLNIHRLLRRNGCDVPLVADIHFTPNAAELAARFIEKVRINPGNYADRKKFETIVYDQDSYLYELDRVRQRFSPLVKICKEYGTALRVGVNHGSLSDRITSRYGDSPSGMVESAMEFLRIAEDLRFYNIVVSMKSSNPLVMVEAYHRLVRTMQQELGHCYPLHLGVTEAGDGNDGRIKSAIGIGTLLEEGLGDTIRVSLTEPPEAELPVCRSIIENYARSFKKTSGSSDIKPAGYAGGTRVHTNKILNIGGGSLPVVLADLSRTGTITRQTMGELGYNYDAETDKWNIGNASADYVFTQAPLLFPPPGGLGIVIPIGAWRRLDDQSQYYPLFDHQQYGMDGPVSGIMNFVTVPADQAAVLTNRLTREQRRLTVLVARIDKTTPATDCLRRLRLLQRIDGLPPVIFQYWPELEGLDEPSIAYTAGTARVILNGWADGLWLVAPGTAASVALVNQIAFGILQATRARILGTEYVSCPSCGRTLFDLQTTTEKVRAATGHLKGVKIAIMGCIVNGPGEMADADFGYVGSGPGKISLYKGKEVVSRNVSDQAAVDTLINLIKQSGRWAEPP